MVPSGVRLVKFYTAVFLLLSTSSRVLAGGVDAGKPLIATPGKSVCKSETVVLADQPAQGRLCVTEGSMVHDRYVLEIGGQKVLSGIDDETTKGLSGYFRSVPINMVCESELKPPADDDPMVASLSKEFMSHPGTSTEQAHQTAVHMLSTEIGRQCVVKQGEQILMKVPVRFD